jgi:hypothetical protein
MSPCWAEAKFVNERTAHASASSANFLNTSPCQFIAGLSKRPLERWQRGDAAVERLRRTKSSGLLELTNPNDTKIWEHSGAGAAEA